MRPTLPEAEAELGELAEVWLERHVARQPTDAVERAIDQATTDYKHAERALRREAERGTITT